MTADVVLATLNARYSHASHGLRCLRANLGRWRERSEIVEGTLESRPLDFVAALLERSPRVIGLGVYVWNAAPSLDVVRLLRKVAPDVIVVVGGPEVSHELEAQEICALAHHVVRGEGEDAFRALVDHHLGGGGGLGQVPGHVVDGGTPDLGELASPYAEYTDEDVAQRTVYVEASRGCPFRCSFCLSALDKTVRPFPQDALLDELGRLWERGLRQFKFVDRTFNLAIDEATRILRFFHDRTRPAAGGRAEEVFLHFEMIPDRLPEALLEELGRFPPGAVQLEVGLQTFDAGVARAVDRKTDHDVAVHNLRRLRAHTGVHVHADLIAGLPGETWASFGRGFDRLIEAGPQEIQLGFLKRLRGTPLAGRDHGLLFDDAPPYEVLRTPTLTFDELVELRRMARVWDLVFNRGRFPQTSALLLERWRGDVEREGSPFAGLRALTQGVGPGGQALHGLSLLHLAELVHGHLLAEGVPAAEAAAAVGADYTQGGRRRTPPFLARAGATRAGPPGEGSGGRRPPSALPGRQQRHRAAGEGGAGTA